MKALAMLAPLMLAPLSLHAQDRQYQDWSVSLIDSDTIAAVTTNDSGGIFGKVCYVSTQNCIWVITSSAPCDTDGKYAAMSNSAAGANLHHLTCLPRRQFGQQLMTFDEYDTLVSISNQAGLVGFAVPIVDGQFRVFRFSLAGSNAAIAQAENLVVAAGHKGTRDLSL